MIKSLKIKKKYYKYGEIFKTINFFNNIYTYQKSITTFYIKKKNRKPLNKKK